MDLSTDRLEPAHIKQLLLYAPDEDEVQQYQRFQQDPAKLSEPDRFIFQVRHRDKPGQRGPGRSREVRTDHPCVPDADGAGVQDPPTQPPLQDHAAGEDGGDEGGLRLHLQGFSGAEEQQEAG